MDNTALDGRLFTQPARRRCGSVVNDPRPLRQQRGARHGSDRTCRSPEEWPVAAATVTPCDPQSPKERDCGSLRQRDSASARHSVLAVSSQRAKSESAREQRLAVTWRKSAKKRLAKNKHYVSDWCKQNNVGRW